MNRSQFWANFRLGEELHISGGFIYTGLRCFHDMDNLHYEDEIFEVLYNLSIGLERLIKVAVILIEHDDTVDQESFEKSLISHTHLDLLARVRHAHEPRLARPHSEFLQLLSTFYRTHRYGRYLVASAGHPAKEKDALHRFIGKHLGVEIQDDLIVATPNCPRFKRFLGRVVGKIAAELYDVIDQEARRRNLYTYELRSGSKAAKIFGRKEYDFENEEVLWKELLLFLATSQEDGGHIGFMKQMEPLPFDPGLDADYIQALGSDKKKLEIMDELETLYEDLGNVRERLEMIRVLGNPNVHFQLGDDADEEWE